MGGVYCIQTFLDFNICFIFTRPLRWEDCLKTDLRKAEED